MLIQAEGGKSAGLPPILTSILTHFISSVGVVSYNIHILYNKLFR